MQIRRIQVPDYRALRGIDLQFDAAADPQLFPIGSENGGGKSTLLQLVFVLLHCAGDEERADFIRNLMASFHHPEDQAEKLLARFELWDGEELHDIEFVSLGPKYLEDALGTALQDVGFEAIRKVKLLEQGIRRLKELFHLLSIQNPSPQDTTRVRQLLAHPAIVSSVSEDRRRLIEQEYSANRSRSAERKFNPLDLLEPLEDTDVDLADRVLHTIAAKNDTYLTWYPEPSSETVRHALVARTNGSTKRDIDSLLQRCRGSIFMLAPSSQPYLFLPPSSRKSFIATPPKPRDRSGKSQESTSVAYHKELELASRDLPGFFAYDWLSVAPLVELFRQSRDQDFSEAVKTGNYGSAYTDMLKDLNALLCGKEVKPLEDLSGVQFSIVGPDGATRALGPEDLSRGELKRLMVYAWLKANQTDDAIVLMDELEVSFHPDWQYGVAKDLTEWAPKTQFLLATHSYDICRAVTPAHVRELEPKLTDGGRGEPRS